MSVQATLPIDNRISLTPKSRYSWQIFKNGNLFADLTGICKNRQFIWTRNDSDQINFSVSLDALVNLSARLHVNLQDILQSWVSEVRISRYGTTLMAGELLPWNTNIGSDRMVNVQFRGWLELMKWRRTSNTYTNQSALTIMQAEFNATLARTYGNGGNYNGLVVGAVPASDSTNVYPSQVFDQKTIYDVLTEMSAENNGVDLEITWDKRLNIYWPAMGTARADILFSYPYGNVKDIQYSVDPTKSFNSLTARGKGIDSSQVPAFVSDVPSQQAYGLREDVIDYSNVSDETQLTNLATSDLNLYKQPVILHTIIFDGSGRTSAPQVGTFHVGDLIQISVTNFNLYQDINQFFRIDQIQVDIDDNDMETVTMMVSIPTA